MQLSKDRAAETYLVGKFNINAGRLETMALGQSRATATNDTDEGKSDDGTDIQLKWEDATDPDGDQIEVSIEGEPGTGTWEIESITDTELVLFLEEKILTLRKE